MPIEKPDLESVEAILGRMDTMLNETQRLVRAANEQNMHILTQLEAAKRALATLRQRKKRHG